MKTKNSLQYQAYKAIRRQIIYADLEPGRKVSEKLLEEVLAIGRTPIREALIQLRQQGLVDTKPQSGNYISLIDLVSAKNARFAREHLERQIMLECCAKIDKKTQKVLQTIIEQQEKAVTKQDARTFFQSDNLFHETCFAIVGREELWQWLEDHNTHLERFRWLRVTTAGLKWNKIMTQHYQLLQALVRRDPDEAGFLTAMHLHMMLDEQETVVNAYPQYFKAGES